MEALINAGGKGSRMGKCGIEKPMQLVDGLPVVRHVVDAMRASSAIDRVLVSVSPNTRKTEEYLKGIGIETVLTSGDDFMMDLRESLSVLEGDYVLTCPSDVPFVTPEVFDRTVAAFRPEMQSMIVMIGADTVTGLGIEPSYTREINGKEWVLSGVTVMDRKATINGDYLREECLLTDWKELAVNINTQDELSLARRLG